MNNPIIQSFRDGILYFFGLETNPIKKHYHTVSHNRTRHNKGLSGWEIDARNLAADWQHVGNDIRQAYEQESAATAGH